MYASQNNSGAAALIFSKGKPDTSVMLVSSPPPLWLSDEDLTQILICESGMYCLYFLFFSERGGKAQLSINGRAIPGSITEAENGIICNSAVCSIRDAALPCSLNVVSNKACNDGIFLVIQCRV